MSPLEPHNSHVKSVKSEAVAPGKGAHFIKDSDAQNVLNKPN